MPRSHQPVQQHQFLQEKFEQAQRHATKGRNESDDENENNHGADGALFQLFPVPSRNSTHVAQYDTYNHNFEARVSPSAAGVGAGGGRVAATTTATATATESATQEKVEEEKRQRAANKRIARKKALFTHDGKGIPLKRSPTCAGPDIDQNGHGNKLVEQTATCKEAVYFVPKWPSPDGFGSEKSVIDTFGALIGNAILHVCRSVSTENGFSHTFSSVFIACAEKDEQKQGYSILIEDINNIKVNAPSESGFLNAHNNGAISDVDRDSQEKEKKRLRLECPDDDDHASTTPTATPSRASSTASSTVSDAQAIPNNGMKGFTLTFINGKDKRLTLPIAVFAFVDYSYVFAGILYDIDTNGKPVIVKKAQQDDDGDANSEEEEPEEEENDDDDDDGESSRKQKGKKQRAGAAATEGKKKKKRAKAAAGGEKRQRATYDPSVPIPAKNGDYRGKIVFPLVPFALQKQAVRDKNGFMTIPELDANQRARWSSFHLHDGLSDQISAPITVFANVHKKCIRRLDPAMRMAPKERKALDGVFVMVAMDNDQFADTDLARPDKRFYPVSLSNLFSRFDGNLQNAVDRTNAVQPVVHIGGKKCKVVPSFLVNTPSGDVFERVETVHPGMFSSPPFVSHNFLVALCLLGVHPALFSKEPAPPGAKSKDQNGSVKYRFFKSIQKMNESSDDDDDAFADACNASSSTRPQSRVGKKIAVAVRRQSGGISTQSFEIASVDCVQEFSPLYVVYDTAKKRGNVLIKVEVLEIGTDFPIYFCTERRRSAVATASHDCNDRNDIRRCICFPKSSVMDDIDAVTGNTDAMRAAITSERFVLYGPISHHRMMSAPVPTRYRKSVLIERKREEEKREKRISAMLSKAKAEVVVTIHHNNTPEESEDGEDEAYNATSQSEPGQWQVEIGRRNQNPSSSTSDVRATKKRSSKQTRTVSSGRQKKKSARNRTPPTTSTTTPMDDD